MGRLSLRLGKLASSLIAYPQSYDPQPCYCGELNCSGTIGGKTQTDLRLMDPLYLEGEWHGREYKNLLLKYSHSALGHREEDSHKASRRRKELAIDDIKLVSRRH